MSREAFWHLLTRVPMEKGVESLNLKWSGTDLQVHWQVESLLDEATAELGKMEFSPMLSTIEADFKIKKSVPLHTTLRIECQVLLLLFCLLFSCHIWW